MDFLREMLKKEIIKEISVFMFLLILFYLLRNIIDLFLLTFLFTYLIYSLEKVIIMELGKYIKIKEVFIIIALYSVIFIFLTYFMYKYLPLIVDQGITIINEIVGGKSQSVTSKIEQYLYPLVGKVDIGSYVKGEVNSIFQVVRSLGKWGINIILALILSLFFIIGRKTIKKFLYKFKASKISMMYGYIVLFGKDFLNSFGKVIQVQILVAVTNTIISLITLSFMNFPEPIALAFMISMFSLIPIVGIIMSLIPLCIIAFNIGGVVKAIYVFLIVALLYVVESYVLAPKFMSSKTQIPVFFIFLFLIISQRFMGMWGLLMGIPLFMFILHMLGINLNEK
ncbi:AI-2E family transporter [Clostridium sp. P21]|uniref:AI-2E family transporter n=1 Tax=Clostridium muellerianum TaxID=2716538 RepID=A0A7Y0EDV4_9CLOT|nr:AI-2E family transporter [Clostridium muellerianum]NMM61625.1 AI-2E family transporter [Clostridium muellerianum]